MHESVQPQKKLTIGVLYGFRALMVLFVCNYHIWQQGWLGQYLRIGGTLLDFDFFTRSSYLFVDGMLLLSGFLLYLPYARQSVYHTPVPNARRFYENRLVRILPSYGLSVLLVLWLFVLPQGAYRDASAQNLDILTHLTFTFTFLRETYLQTPINGVLWTIAIEMQFYLIFPLLARATQKKPTVTLCCMAIVGMLFRLMVATRVQDTAMWVNQMPAFLDVYALGMLGSIVFVRLTRLTEVSTIKRELGKALHWLTPVLFAAGCALLIGLMRLQTEQGLIDAEHLRLSQLSLRLPLALTLLLMMLSASFWPRFLQKLLDNRLMRFLSTISFNLYIWHQVVSIQLARGLFPQTLHSDQNQQIIFTLLSFSLSILVAMAATYGWEQPWAKLTERLRNHHKEKNRHERSPRTETEPSADSLLVRNEEG